MIRKALFVLALLAAVLIGASVAESYAGNVHIEWLGYAVDTTVLFALLFMLAVYTLLMAAVRLLASLLFPGRQMERYRRRRLAEGLADLSAALLSGDVDAMERRLKQLPEGFRQGRQGLTNAVMARIAEERGDAPAARALSEGLRPIPEYRIAGLRGLAVAARMEGDDAAALKHAEEALSRAKHAAWADRMIKDISVCRRQWQTACEALKRLSGYAMAPQERREYAEVSLLHAGELLRMDQKSRALRAAHAAYALLPEDAGVALRYAGILAEAGELGALEELTAERWKTAPSLPLGRLFLRAAAGCGEAARLKKIARLQEARPDLSDTWLLKAELCLELGRVAAAKEALAQSLTLNPCKDVYALLAEIEEKHGAGDRFVIREYREKAAEEAK